MAHLTTIKHLDQIFTTSYLDFCCFSGFLLLLAAMGNSWLEMHLKGIQTSSLKSWKHGQSWSTGLEERGIMRSQQ